MTNLADDEPNEVHFIMRFTNFRFTHYDYLIGVENFKITIRESTHKNHNPYVGLITKALVSLD